MYQPLKSVCGRELAVEKHVLCTDYDKKVLLQNKDAIMFLKVLDNL